MRAILKLSVLFMVISLYSLASAAPVKVKICGTGDSQHVLRELADIFEKNNPGIDIVIPDTIGSSAGIAAAARGECDLGRAARMLNDSEKESGLKSKIFAFSPVVFAVNKKSVTGVTNISSETVIMIYSGKVKNWRELGGPSLEIAPINRESGDSSRSIVEKAVAGFKELKNPVGKTIEHNTPKAVETISTTQGAVGYVPLSAVDKEKAAVLSFNGVEPTPYAVWEGKYKLVTPFTLVWKDELRGAAKAFVDFIMSKEASGIIVSHGLVPAK